jgi:hypothetical protein
MYKSQGRFVWHELSTTDPAAGCAFFERVAGWTTRTSDYNDQYTLFSAGNAIVAGAVPVDAQVPSRAGPPHWLPYLCVYDLDASVRQVRTLGGALLYGPHEVPTVGCWAAIRDPFDAMVGLYEPDHEAPPASVSASGDAFRWHELTTPDVKGAFEFYRALAQWDKTSEYDMGAMGPYLMFGQAGTDVGGMLDSGAGGTASASWLTYLFVDDIARATSAVQQLGGVVLEPTHGVPTGRSWIAKCADAQGATFALHTSHVPSP